MRRVSYIDGVANDLRYASRTLRRSPSFTATAIMTLALGIAANTAMFSVVNAVILRPLPYQDPDRLAMLWTNDPKRDIREEGTSYPTFLDWRSQSRAFADMAICSRGNPVTLTGGNEPERVMGEAVSANLFPLLGVTPILGRTFSDDEEQQRERVVVLTALGAGQLRLVRQLAVESGLLVVGAAVVGLALALLAVRTLQAAAPPVIPRLDEMQLDARVLIFTGGVSILGGLLFAIVPRGRPRGAIPRTPSSKVVAPVQRD
jgi:hypothetical protein